MVNQMHESGRHHEKKQKIGELPKQIQKEAEQAVKVIQHGQQETADQVKTLEKERVQLRIENLRDRLEEVRQLAISEGCPDPRGKKPARRGR